MVTCGGPGQRTNHQHHAMTPEPYYQALPLDLKPLHYNLSVYDITHDSYKGTVQIELLVQRPTDELHLHYRDLTISQAVAEDDAGNSIGVESVQEHAEKEYLVVKLEREVTSKFSATLHFSGRIQTNMAGFYRSLYTDHGVTKYMLSTQFEATDARRAFPCLDEPDRKATFSVSITAHHEWCVLGNMPVLHETASNGLKTVTFQTSPVMSTYLVAWAMGDFEYIESQTDLAYLHGKPLPVRIYTTKGYAKDAQFALELAPKIVDLFSTIFEVQYPLPKLDLLAVHSFLHNAMENWGLITYRSTALLYSDGQLDPSYKQKVAYVVAHEIAHQWFGNLVTMQWWDELWLNEGFATWVGFYAVDRLFPEWDVFAGFVSESLQEALRLDGLRNSHPIKVPVVDALDIDQLFDAISYLKGASTILMLSSYLGQSTFLSGVARYLKGHLYGNARSQDLWASISAASGLDVASMMELWISQIGFPLVHVAEDGDGLVLRQERFLNGGDVSEAEDKTQWWVPLNVVAAPNADSMPSDTNDTLSRLSFSLKETRLDAVTSGLFKLNKDTQAPFRVNYEQHFFHTHVVAHFAQLLTKDKVGVIADLAALATSGHNPTAAFLDLVRYVGLENDYLGEEYVLWLEVTSRMAAVMTTFDSPQLGAFCSRLYAPLAVKLLRETGGSADFKRAKLRAHLLFVASTYGIAELDQYAARAFAQWKESKQMDPALRKFVFSAVVSSPQCTHADFEAIMQEVTHPTSLDSREVALTALGNVANGDLADTLMSYLIDEAVIPTMDAHFLAAGLSKNTKVRRLFWAFFKNNYSHIHRLMSANMVVLDRFVKTTLCNYLTFAMAREVQDFFLDKDVHGFERALHQVIDQIKIRAAWNERDHHVVQAWE